VDEAAAKLRISSKTLLRFGKVRGVKIGRQWRILGSALLDLSIPEGESEADLLADWLVASSPALREVWDNEEDAVYDDFPER
jgi:hypothetical protein